MKLKVKFGIGNGYHYLLNWFSLSSTPLGEIFSETKENGQQTYKEMKDKKQPDWALVPEKVVWYGVFLLQKRMLEVKTRQNGRFRRLD